MSSWQELKTALQTFAEVDEADDDQIALTLPIRDGHTTREQRVMVQRYHAWGVPMLEVRSAFGELRPGEEGELLRRNLDLPLGSIAVHGDYLVLLYKGPMAALTGDDALTLVMRVAELADVLEERRGGDRF